MANECRMIIVLGLVVTQLVLSACASGVQNSKNKEKLTLDSIGTDPEKIKTHIQLGINERGKVDTTNGVAEITFPAKYKTPKGELQDGVVTFKGMLYQNTEQKAARSTAYAGILESSNPAAKDFAVNVACVDENCESVIAMSYSNSLMNWPSSIDGEESTKGLVGVGQVYFLEKQDPSAKGKGRGTETHALVGVIRDDSETPIYSMAEAIDAFNKISVGED